MTTPTGAATPQAPPDPTIIRAVTEYKVFQGLDDLKDLRKPMTWFMTGAGLVPVKVLPLGTFIGKATGARVPGLPELKEGVALNIPKLPWQSLCEVVAFFKEVNAKKKAEAMVQFFWSPERKTYLAHAPEQDVSGGGVRHVSNHDKDGNLLHVFDIHSHHTMQAYWSGTDDRDEARFEGRLYGVIGQIENPIPMMKWRTRVGGTFLDLLLEDVVDLDNAPSCKVVKEFKAGDLLKVAGQGKDNHKFVFTYEPFDSVEFPKAWWDAIKNLPVVTGVPDAHGGMGFRGPHGGGGPVVDRGYIDVGKRVLDAAERKALEEEGLVEVRPGQWCYIDPASPYHPHKVAAGSPTVTTPTRTAATPALTPPTTGGTTTDRHLPTVGRGVFVYDRTKGHLYRKEGHFLYRSMLDIVTAARTFPTWHIDFVEKVDSTLVREEWRGGVYGH